MNDLLWRGWLSLGPISLGFHVMKVMFPTKGEGISIHLHFLHRKPEYRA